MVGYGEDTLVEQPAIALFAALGWETANCYGETFGARGTLGRATAAEVVLRPRLRAALARLNPDASADAIDQAVERLTQDRGVLGPAQANRDVYALLKDGVTVRVRGADGDGETVEKLTVIDWREPARNDFFLASQFWITGEMYKRRADLVGFVNGLPLLLIELKASHRNMRHAYDENLRDYKAAIPHLFWYNAAIILSNGSQSRAGTITAGWEHFADWKKITSEGEQGVISLDTIIRGMCAPARFLDLVENFTLFQEAQGGLVKVLAKYHQYFGVNNALAALGKLGDNAGRLGVFWHTQGSGKSVSMVFFSQKVLRTIPGAWTFVIVTDRQELDEQIYKHFVSAGAVTDKEAQATSGEHLRLLLREDHRYIFTLIQKFHTERGARFPVLSRRADIIVMTDEAHRSQYETLALNMRNALPNAGFIGFTGTPLLAGDEKTRAVFGEYVSIYNFQQSIEDGATVPLYYENRIPELQLTNPNLNDEIEAVLDEAELDEAQQEKLERQFAREYHLLTREARLDEIARDLVAHFRGRGYPGKAMVVSIDKATAVKMYDRVHAVWQATLDDLRGRAEIAPETERAGLRAQIAEMEATDMAVVVSQSQNEGAELAKKGVDIVPHRRRIVAEDLEAKFKQADDPLRIVFVCAMWMTGFDVPSCSTIYLDKPMRNHTLMQTIARANRVFKEKVNGLIVDYVGVFRDLQRALALYAAPASGGAGELPVETKAALVERLRAAITEATAFCVELEFEPLRIQAATGFERIHLRDQAVEAILVNDTTKARYLALATGVARLYKAILPDAAANEFAPIAALFNNIAEAIRSLTPPADISGVMGAIEDVLDHSVAAEQYVIRAAHEDSEAYRVDLSAIDFDALRAHFEQGHKRSEIEKIRALLNGKLQRMVRLNRGRMDFLETYQRMIDEYNAGATSPEELFERLARFSRALTEEEQRTIAERLSEEELAVFDLLTKPEIALTEAERKQVKKLARELLETLKTQKLVLDWRKEQQTLAAVRVSIRDALDKLPEPYTKELYEAKRERVFQHVFESYFGEGRSIYARAS